MRSSFCSVFVLGSLLWGMEYKAHAGEPLIFTMEAPKEGPKIDSSFDSQAFNSCPPSQLFWLSIYNDLERRNLRSTLAMHKSESSEGKFGLAWIESDPRKKAKRYHELITDPQNPPKVRALAANNRIASMDSDTFSQSEIDAAIDLSISTILETGQGWLLHNQSTGDYGRQAIEKMID